MHTIFKGLFPPLLNLLFIVEYRNILIYLTIWNKLWFLTEDETFCLIFEDNSPYQIFCFGLTSSNMPVIACISLTRWGKIYWLQNARIMCRKSDRKILSSDLVYPLKEIILDYFYTVHSSSGERFLTRNILPLQPNSQYRF